MSKQHARFRQAEIGSTLTMLNRAAARIVIRSDWLVADTTCGSKESVIDIILHFIAVTDKGARKNGTLSLSGLIWDDENDCYMCPKDDELRHALRKPTARNAHKTGNADQTVKRSAFSSANSKSFAT